MQYLSELLSLININICLSCEVCMLRMLQPISSALTNPFTLNGNAAVSTGYPETLRVLKADILLDAPGVHITASRSEGSLQVWHAFSLGESC